MLILPDNSSLFPFHSWGTRRLGRGKTGCVVLVLPLLPKFWWCCVSYKNGASLTLISNLWFLKTAQKSGNRFFYCSRPGARWWESFSGMGGCVCVRVCVRTCKAFEPLRWVSDGLPLEVLTGGQRQQLPGDLTPSLQVAGRDAGGPANLRLANPRGDTHYLAILMPGLACCSSCDSSIRGTSPEPLLWAGAWLPLTIQIPFLWHLSMPAQSYHFFLFLLVLLLFGDQNSFARLTDLRIQEADKTFVICWLERVFAAWKLRPQVQNREFQGSFS